MSPTGMQSLRIEYDTLAFGESLSKFEIAAFVPLVFRKCVKDINF